MDAISLNDGYGHLGFIKVSEHLRVFHTIPVLNHRQQTNKEPLSASKSDNCTQTYIKNNHNKVSPNPVLIKTLNLSVMNTQVQRDSCLKAFHMQALSGLLLFSLSYPVRNILHISTNCMLLLPTSEEMFKKFKNLKSSLNIQVLFTVKMYSNSI